MTLQRLLEDSIEVAVIYITLRAIAAINSGKINSTVSFYVSSPMVIAHFG